MPVDTRETRRLVLERDEEERPPMRWEWTGPDCHANELRYIKWCDVTRMHIDSRVCSSNQQVDGLSASAVFSNSADALRCTYGT